jgi:hypothetical protein
VRGFRVATVLLAVLALSCGDPRPIEGHDVWIGVAADAAEVDLGAPFTVTVTRIWLADLEPGELPDDALSPLSVTLLETSRREDGRHVEETRRYRAWAYALEDVTVPPIAFTVRSSSGAAERTARSSRLDVRVRPALDPADPGPPELPGGLMSAGSSWWIVVAAVVVLVAAALAIVLRRRRAAIPSDEPEDDAGPAPWERALGRLAALRSRRPASPAEDLAFHAEAASGLRDYLGEQLALGSDDLTTEEVLAAARAADAPEAFLRGVLADLLRQCDLVKFARLRPSRREREDLLATAEVFVRETAGVPAERSEEG